MIIIIGILAAIAIPTFLNQRTKAHNATAQSDLRDAATFQETNYTDHGAYTGNVTGSNSLESEGFHGSTDVNLTTPTGGQTYCMQARHTNGDTTYKITNDATSVVEGTCNA